MSLFYTRVTDTLGDCTLHIQNVESRLSFVERKVSELLQLQQQQQLLPSQNKSSPAFTPVLAPGPASKPVPAPTPIKPKTTAPAPVKTKTVTGYHLFTRENRDAIKDYARQYEAYTGTKLCMSSAAAQLWEQLPAEEKDNYNSIAMAERPDSA